MSWNIKTQGGGFAFQAEWDDRQWRAATKQMQKEAKKIFVKAISGVLRTETENVRQALKRGGDGITGSALAKVADSLAVESGTQGHNAVVRVGSEPMDSGGVSGSRGGKLAQIYEFGAPPFNYSPKWKVGKEVENSAIRGFGGGNDMGFINVGKTSMHPGFKKAFGNEGWLTRIYNKSIPQMEDAILDEIQKAWGGNR